MLEKNDPTLLKVLKQYLATNNVNIMSGLYQTLPGMKRNKRYTINNKEKNQPIETDSEIICIC